MYKVQHYLWNSTFFKITNIIKQQLIDILFLMFFLFNGITITLISLYFCLTALFDYFFTGSLVGLYPQIINYVAVKTSFQREIGGHIHNIHEARCIDLVGCTFRKWSMTVYFFWFYRYVVWIHMVGWREWQQPQRSEWHRTIGSIQPQYPHILLLYDQWSGIRSDHLAYTQPFLPVPFQWAVSGGTRHDGLRGVLPLGLRGCCQWIQYYRKSPSCRYVGK